MIRIRQTREHHWLYGLTDFYYPQHWVGFKRVGWWSYYRDDLLSRVRFRDLTEAQRFVDHQMIGGDRIVDVWRKD